MPNARLVDDESDGHGVFCGVSIERFSSGEEGELAADCARVPDDDEAYELQGVSPNEPIRGTARFNDELRPTDD
jgi:hypothetical protein